MGWLQGVARPEGVLEPGAEQDVLDEAEPEISDDEDEEEEQDEQDDAEPDPEPAPAQPAAANADAGGGGLGLPGMGGAAAGLGAAHQAMLQGQGPTGVQPYRATEMFPLKLAGLILLMCFTLFCASLTVIVVPGESNI